MEYLYPFLLGGTSLAGVKYVSKYFAPQKAAIIATIPLSLISSYFLETRDVQIYCHNYIHMVLIALVTAIVYYFLLKYYNVGKALLITVGIWVILATIKAIYLV